MKEAHCGQLHPHRPRSKLKMVTLHGEQPSNKNININISYNLTEKGGRVLDSANEPEWIGSGANTPTSHGRIDCLGRKVTQHDVLVTENANRSPHATIRKGKEPSAQPQDIVSNECEISIRVVNKQRQRKPAPLSKHRWLWQHPQAKVAASSTTRSTSRSTKGSTSVRIPIRAVPASTDCRPRSSTP